MNKKYERAWGWFTLLYEDDHSNHKVKKIHIYPVKKISLQSHNERNEHCVIVKGNVKIRENTKIHTLECNDYIYFPEKTPYSIENKGANNAEIVVTQIGNYLGEDDIVRYEDDIYGLK
jgi:mannose-1-phosphate guanylyltransferase/mannose-6-phosphate isomerase